jgi:hypothetical protein
MRQIWAIACNEVRQRIFWAGLALTANFLLMSFYLWPRQYAIGTDDSRFIGYFWCFSAVWGALLGILQIKPETSPDRWALLVHRPATRSQIYLGISLAGLILYAVPLLAPYYASFLASPFLQNTPRLFVWQLTLPGIAICAGGLSALFAGHLVAVRRARWVGSRLVPMLIAAVGIIAVVRCANFWNALAWAGTACALLFVSAWTCFVAQGEDAWLSRLGRAVLATVMALSIGICLTGFTGVADNLRLARLADEYGSYHDHFRYVLRADGTLLRREPGTGNYYPVYGTKREEHSYDYLSVLILQPRSQDYHPYHSSARYLSSLNLITNERWFFVHPTGELRVFDWRGRDISAEALGENNGRKFEYLEQNFTYTSFYCLSDRQYAYRFDVSDKVRLLPICQLLPGESLRSAISLVPRINAWQNEQTTIALATDRRVVVVKDGIAIPMPIDPHRLDLIELVATKDGYSALLHADSQPARFLLISASGELLSTEELPTSTSTQSYQPSYGFVPLAQAIAVPPLFAAMTYVYSLGQGMSGILVAISGVAAAILAVLAFALAREDGHSRLVQIGLSCSMLPLGPIALLTYLAMRDPPVREQCPSCGRKRVVTREACEYCSAPFAPAPKKGIEIFV